MQFYTNGLGANAGDTLVTCEGLIMSQRVIWVNSATGNDGSPTFGYDREEPLQTVGAAVTVAFPGDIIVLMAGFYEVILAPIVPWEGVAIVGEGSVGGLPSCQLVNNQAAGEIFTVSAIGVEFRNIRFPPNQQANTQPKIEVTADNCRIIGCYFEGGPNDHFAQVRYSSIYETTVDYEVICNTTFISIAPTCADLPYTGVEFDGASYYLTMDGVTFDDSQFGWQWDYSFISTIGLAYFRKIGISLLHGASMNVVGVSQAGAIGWLNTQTRTGGGRVDWY